MADYSWTIRTKSNGDIVADGLLQGPPTYTRAGETPLDLRFNSSRQAAYEQLRDYVDWAGKSDTGQTVTNLPWYRDTVPDRAPIDSLVIAAIPADGIDLPGLWGVIVAGEDASNAPMTNLVLSFDVFVLAEFDEYADHVAVADEFSA